MDDIATTRPRNCTLGKFLLQGPAGSNVGRSSSVCIGGGWQCAGGRRQGLSWWLMPWCQGNGRGVVHERAHCHFAKAMGVSQGGGVADRPASLRFMHNNSQNKIVLNNDGPYVVDLSRVS